MKRFCPNSDSSGSCEKKIKFSQSELQMLVKEEVQKEVKKNNDKLEVLSKTIQQLQRDVDYEGSIEKLEARIEKISKKAEKALTAMKSNKKFQSLLPSFLNDEVITIDCDDETVPQKINTSRRNKKRQENKKNVLDKDFNIQKQAIMNALADLCRTLPPPTPESKPLTTQRKEESVSPCQSNNPQNTNPQQKELPYPPLPMNPFPSNLAMEALSYNVPQKLVVHLALIKEPVSLSVMWNGEEKAVSQPPMESYSIFLTTEKVKGSGVFPAWRLLGNVVAKSLPMYVSIKKYKAGYKLCVAVVGKDIYGRYGPYSEVVSAHLPE
ncbi:activating transcription factor 7-interacting protein 2 [Phyllopteryx taeniolatus]|uniref:activating transcription factor 7-interacting protein 2 n=1 Tax=Phyllopteryx taeniolatus TaxID=161469 RepID=UPI002AD44ECF|nr:activating transcription factor 7-interacting protein 2 [Phyllopteryx taeniolatus]